MGREQEEKLEIKGQGLENEYNITQNSEGADKERRGEMGENNTKGGRGKR